MCQADKNESLPWVLWVLYVINCYCQVLICIILFIPFQSVLAAEQVANEKQNFIKQSPVFNPNNLSDTSLWNVFFSLFSVLALILLLAWLLKRFHPGLLQQQELIKIVSVLTIGKNQKLMIVDVGGEQILLGVAANDMQALHVLKEPLEMSVANPPDNSFIMKLQDVLARDKNNDKS